MEEVIMRSSLLKITGESVIFIGSKVCSRGLYKNERTFQNKQIHTSKR